MIVDTNNLISTLLSIFLTVTSTLINLVMENPVVGLAMTGIAVLVAVFLVRKIETWAWNFSNFIIMIAFIIFLLVSLTALGYNVTKFLGFLPKEFSVNNWLLDMTKSLLGK